MTELESDILDLMKEDYSPYSISVLLGIDMKTLYYEMNKLKYSFQNTRRIIHNGNVQDTGREQNEYAIWTNENNKHIKLLIVGDMHVGSKNESRKNMDLAYNTAINENIHIALNLGDLIDGELGGPKYYRNVDSQVERFIDTYPMDKNIVNLVCLGNHDYYINTETNIGKSINEERPDIICMGYGIQTVKIKDDKITLRHPIAHEQEPSGGLILRGHTHISMFQDNGYEYCPCISNVLWNGNKPGFYTVEIEFKDGLIKKCLFVNHIIYDGKVIKVGEFLTRFKTDEKAKQKTIGHIL